MATRSTYYRYHFRLGNKIVHTGITNDIDLRELEFSVSLGSIMVATLDDDAPVSRYAIYEPVLLRDPA